MVDLNEMFPVVLCANGVRLSVQASAWHRCTPQDNTGPYTHVEIGFPDAVNTELLAYRQRPLPEGDYNANDLGNVYDNVPLDVLNRFTAEHGGVRTELAWWMNQGRIKKKEWL